MKYQGWALLVLALLILAACDLAGAPAVPDPAAVPTPPAAAAVPATLPPTTSRPTATPVESRWIDLLSPVGGEEVASPIRLQGRTNLTPINRELIVRLYDRAWHLLAQTSALIEGEVGQPGTFSGEISFTAYTGPATIEIVSPVPGESALVDPGPLRRRSAASGGGSYVTSVMLVAQP